MFEVIISFVRTGKVTRQLFGTREEAERFVLRHEEKLLTPRVSPRTGEVTRKPQPLSNYRVEIRHRDAPATHRPAPARRAA